MRIISSLILMVTLFANTGSIPLKTQVISVGADIEKEEKTNIIKMLNIKDSIPEVIFTNDDEKEYLLDLIPENNIGNKAVICAYIQKLPENEGIKLDTHNLTYVSAEMITNAMITCGMKDVYVKVLAPYKVFGVTSMTAVIKAYEKLDSNNISEICKVKANQELALEAEIGHKIGMQKATQFINELKLEVLTLKYKEKNKIINSLNKIEDRFQIKLNEADRNNMLNLMENIDKTNLQIDTIKIQQKDILSYLNDSSKTANKKGFLAEIFYKISELLKKIFLFLKRRIK